MDVQELLQQARDSLTVGRVFGEPIETGGVTFIPAARVRGGGGGGEGQSPDEAGPAARGPGSGSGGGFGMDAKPVGAYVIRDGKVSWQPAVDVNRIVLGGQVTAIVGLLVIRRILRDRGGVRRR